MNPPLLTSYLTFEPIEVPTGYNTSTKGLKLLAIATWMMVENQYIKHTCTTSSTLIIALLR